MIALPGHAMSIIETLWGVIGIGNIWLIGIWDTPEKSNGIFKIDILGYKLQL